MALADVLFQLGDRDRRITPIELFDGQVGENHTAANFNATLPVVPKERILLLNWVFLRMFADGVLVPSFIRLEYQESGVGAESVIFERNYGSEGLAVQGAVETMWPHELLIPPESQLRIEYTYSGVGGGNHKSTAAIRGLLIPRGNFSL